ncbi:MAG TPA: hypothetical protein VI749_07355 [Candidatus Omnitrophota bacterium]|nr:hypothetical protein [Candidatus Omnitrophota bacterium]
MIIKPKFYLTFAGIILILSLCLLSKPIFSYLERERKYLKEKRKAVEVSYYLPDFEGLARHVISPEESPDIEPDSYISYYTKVEEKYPDLKTVYPFQGYFYAKAEYFDKAIEAYELAVKDNPYHFWSYYNLALLYHRKEDFLTSNNLLHQALVTNPKATFYVINQMPLYRQIWKHIPAPGEVIMSNLKKGIQDCFALLIINLYNLKEYEGLLKVFPMALEKDFSRKAFYYYYAGLASYQLKRYELALLFLQEVIKHDNQNKKAFYYLALVYMESGNEKMADAAMQRAKALNETGAVSDGALFYRLF